MEVDVMTNVLSVPTGSRRPLEAILVMILVPLMFTTALPATVLARDDGAIDQSTLQPPLNPNFTYTCVRERDQGIRCQGTWDPTYRNEPSGLTCGDKDIYVSGGGHEVLTRWHTPVGNALRTFVTLRYDETYSLSPTGGGRIATNHAKWIRTYTYPAPGVLEKRIFTEIGRMFYVTDDHGRVVWVDQGVIRWVPGHEFETIDWSAGRLDGYDDFDAALARLCRALR